MIGMFFFPEEYAERAGTEIRGHGSSDVGP
jgi:hypothetical protein